MKIKIFILSCNLIFCIQLISQNITSTLGTNGLFSIKDNTTTYFSLSQTNGYLTLNRSLNLPYTYTSADGVIYKGGASFIHNYRANGDGRNTFVGLNAGNFTMSATWSYEASNNTGVGENSLAINSSGFQNSAFGSLSLRSNTTGNNNSAFGYGSLYANGTGYSNSCYGSYSMDFNTSGYENTAIGVFSLSRNTAGWQNTSIGCTALQFNSTGWQNTAVGHHALQNNNGNYNTALGYNSGSSVTSGFNLTLLGIDANPSSPTAGNQITLGNGFVTSLRCNVTTITSLSDARDKKNIQDLSLGLDFIAKLKPRQFNWDKREWYDENISDGSKMQEAPTAGFIAQELDEAQTTQNAEWLNLVLKDNPEKWEATAGNLLPVMVKAIQELKAENDELKSQVKSLKSIEERLARLEESIQANGNFKNVKLADEK